MGWIAAVASLAGAGLSYASNRQASKDAAAAARPWGATLPGLGSADFSRGYIDITGSTNQNELWNRINPIMNNSLQNFGALNSGLNSQLSQLWSSSLLADRQGQDQLQQLRAFSGTPGSFFGSNGQQFAQQAQQAQNLGTQALNQAAGGYGGQSFMNAGQNLLNGQGQDYTGNLQNNLNPGQAATDYTNLLRQQALPGEQQATASALTGLFNKGRLGTTGGANQMGALQQAQQQADLGRQVAGQQFGLQQNIQQQQAYDAALNNEQNRQLNNYGAAQSLAGTGAGLFGQSLNNAGLGMGLGQSADAFGFDRMMGLNQTQWDRQNQLYTASNTATQDRFNRAMQMFGLNNAHAQQEMANFQGLFGTQQAQMQGQLDLARLGASVGQSQAGAGVAAAQMRNQGNQDLIAGFLGAINQYTGRDTGDGGK
jgi:hypothetical protein